MSKQGLAARQAAATVLARIIDDGRGLDGLLDTRHGPPALKQLSTADVALVRAIVTAACRHRGSIEYAFGKLMKRPPPKNARHLLHTLHVAAVQILFLDVPDSAAVDLAVAALKSDKRSQRFAGLANAVLRRMSREKDTLFSALESSELARLNMPDWFFKRMKKAYGRDRAMAIAEAHMREPSIDLTVKEKPEEWAEQLGGQVLLGNSVRIDAKGDVASWQGYDAGDWWVQDVAASIPALLLGDISGKRVADLCAAPGGKTAQLAVMGAKVTAVEQSPPRMQRLRDNISRLKLDVDFIEADLFDWSPDEMFDAVLLDAPCSSTGTVRRHPDVQWTKTPETIAELADLQTRMIARAAQFLKPGGILVFANCSIDRAEGEDIVASLGPETSGLRLDTIGPAEVFGRENFLTGQGTVRTLPSYSTASADDDEAPCGMDGFFAARFHRM